MFASGALDVVAAAFAAGQITRLQAEQLAGYLVLGAHGVVPRSRTSDWRRRALLQRIGADA